MKRIAFIICIAVLTSGVFAQEAKAILTAQDIDIVVRNYSSIDAELDMIDEEYDGLLDFESDGILNPGFITQLRAIKVPESYQAVFRKFGLGNNGLEKIIVIMIGTTIVSLESMLGEFIAYPEMDNKAAETGLFLSMLKSSIHASDLALIKSRFSELADLFGQLE